jgi:hypothetical protein
MILVQIPILIQIQVLTRTILVQIPILTLVIQDREIMEMLLIHKLIIITAVLKPIRLQAIQIQIVKRIQDRIQLVPIRILGLITLVVRTQDLAIQTAVIAAQVIQTAATVVRVIPIAAIVVQVILVQADLPVHTVDQVVQADLPVHIADQVVQVGLLAHIADQVALQEVLVLAQVEVLVLAQAEVLVEEDNIVYKNKLNL